MTPETKALIEKIKAGKLVERLKGYNIVPDGPQNIEKIFDNPDGLEAAQALPYLITAYEAMKAERDEAMAALEPFAREAQTIIMEKQGWTGSERPIWEYPDLKVSCYFTFKDIRRAAALHAKGEG